MIKHSDRRTTFHRTNASPSCSQQNVPRHLIKRHLFKCCTDTNPTDTCCADDGGEEHGEVRCNDVEEDRHVIENIGEQPAITKVQETLHFMP